MPVSTASSSSMDVSTSVAVSQPGVGQNGGGEEQPLGSNTELNQTTQFLDQEGGNKLTFITPSDYYSNEVQHNVDLSNFLSRPVMIYDSVWNESDSVGTGVQIQPWYLYLNTLSIKNKIQNYLFMRGKLHLKIVINASPFYYGSLLFNYIPLNGYSTPPVLPDSINSEFLPYSQMPHIWVYPQTNQGGEIV